MDPLINLFRKQNIKFTLLPSLSTFDTPRLLTFIFKNELNSKFENVVWC